MKVQIELPKLVKRDLVDDIDDLQEALQVLNPKIKCKHVGCTEELKLMRKHVGAPVAWRNPCIGVIYRGQFPSVKVLVKLASEMSKSIGQEITLKVKKQ